MVRLPKLPKLNTDMLVFGVLLPILLAVIIARGNTRICTFVAPHKGCVYTEIVDKPASRAQGLSGRKSMPENYGMLFVYHEPDVYCFWMKDMHFSLDMIWLDADKKIVDIQKNVSPKTYPKALCPRAKAQYVVEVNANVADKAKLHIGQQLKF